MAFILNPTQKTKLAAFLAPYTKPLPTTFDSAAAKTGYDLLLNFTSNILNTAPATGMDAATWTWINGARKVNRNEGKFSTFIRVM